MYLIQIHEHAFIDADKIISVFMVGDGEWNITTSNGRSVIGDGYVEAALSQINALNQNITTVK